MRTLFIILMALFTYVNVSAQTYTRQGDKFISTSNRSGSKAAAIKTKFTWQEADGTEHPVYMSTSGSCYILKISKKSGKEYKKYLGPDVSANMCKELGKEYKGKASK